MYISSSPASTVASSRHFHLLSDLGHTVELEPPLPAELFELVIDCLSDSKETLLTVCLTSRHYVNAARRHLFRSLKVTAPAHCDSFGFFLNFLDNTGLSVRSSVRNLSLAAPLVDDRGRALPFGQRTQLTSRLLYSILESLPGLESLSMLCVKLQSTPLPSFEECHLRDLDRVSFLHVTASPLCYGLSDYYSFLSLFREVRTLRVEEYTYRGFSVGGNTVTFFVLGPLPAEFPADLGVVNLELDAPALTTALLVLISNTRTATGVGYRSSSAPHPTLKSLAVSVHELAGLRMFVQKSGLTLTQLDFSLSSWIADTATNRPVDLAALPMLLEGLTLGTSCPDLEAITLHLTIDELRKRTALSFACIMAFLDRPSEALGTLVLDISLGRCVVDAAQFLMGMFTEWADLGRALVRAEVTAVEIVWRYPAADVPPGEVETMQERYSGYLPALIGQPTILASSRWLAC